nr:hypothetical protein Iba_chr04dCG10820 [Ipomoea batatas]
MDNKILEILLSLCAVDHSPAKPALPSFVSALVVPSVFAPGMKTLPTVLHAVHAQVLVIHSSPYL